MAEEQIDPDVVAAVAADAFAEEPDIPASRGGDRGEDEFTVGMGGAPEEYHEEGDDDAPEPDAVDSTPAAAVPASSDGPEPVAMDDGVEQWQVDAVGEALDLGAAQPLADLQADAGMGMGDLRRTLDHMRQRGLAEEVAPGEWSAVVPEEEIDAGVERIEAEIEAEPAADVIADADRLADRPQPILGTTPARALVALDIAFAAPEDDRDTVGAAEQLAAEAVEAVRMAEGTATYKILSVEKYEATRKLL